jgi:hypothetical protein
MKIYNKLSGIEMTNNPVDELHQIDVKFVEGGKHVKNNENRIYYSNK